MRYYLQDRKTTTVRIMLRIILRIRLIFRIRAMGSDAFKANREFVNCVNGSPIGSKAD
jgi:hypothetical protein